MVNNKLQFVLESKTHEILLDFELQANLLIPARRPDLLMINKKKVFLLILDLTVPAYLRVKIKERERRNEYLGFARELRKL